MISAIGVELHKERKDAEQRRHHQHPAVAVLNIGAMHDGVHQEALRVDEDVPLLAFDVRARIVALRVVSPPFSALFTLWLSMIAAVGTPRALPFPAFDIKRVMDPIERAVPAPQIEIIVQRRARRQVFRDRPPLATGAQDLHQAVDDLAQLTVAGCRRAWPAEYAAPQAPIPRRSRRTDSAVGCGRSKSIFPGSTWRRPPKNQAASLKSQMTQPIEHVPRQTLRLLAGGQLCAAALMSRDPRLKSEPDLRPGRLG